MKKILSVAAAIALAAALISCGGDSGDEFDGKVDTIITIQAPSVKAKAYPGVNYISWEPVAQASKYELYRTSDGATSGHLIKTYTVADGVGFAYADIAGSKDNGEFNISDGVTYKYTVVAISGSSNFGSQTVIPARAIYAKPNSTTVSVKAKVPAAGLSIDDAKAFSEYKSFLAKFDEKNLAKNVVITKAQGVKAASGNWGGYYVTYPATAGLEFGVGEVDNTGVGANGAYIGLDDLDSITVSGNYKENFTANKKITPLGSGKKDIYLKIASAASTLYQPIVKKIGDIEVKGINEDKTTRDVEAAYRTATTVEIWWKPATLKETKKETGVANYVVYRTSSADNYDEYTVVSGTITEKKLTENATTGNTVISVPNYNGGTVANNPTATTGATKVNDKEVSVVYSITDTITDNKATYRYYVVHKNGEYYGAKAKSKADSSVVYAVPADFDNAPAKPSIVEVKQAAKAADDQTELQIFVKKANANQTLTLKAATLAKDYKEVKIDTFVDFTTDVKLENYAGDNFTYVAYFKGAYNTDYVFKLTATETGKEGETSVYTTGGVGSLPLNGIPSVTLMDDDNATDLKYIVVVYDSTLKTAVTSGKASYEDYTYKLYSVTTSANRYFEDYITVKEEDLGEVSLSALTDTNKTKYGLTAYTTKEAQTADTTGTVFADFVGINSVTAPKPTDDVNGKYSHTDSVRFYVVKTHKTDKTVTKAVAATGTAAVTGAFTNVNVK
jgi:hypothetical protein